MARIEDKKLVFYEPSRGVAAKDFDCVLADDENGLWIGHARSGLSHFQPDTIEVLVEEPVSGPMLRDRKGRLWYADEGRLCCIFDNHVERLEIGGRINNLLEDRGGALWIASEKDGAGLGLEGGLYCFASCDAALSGDKPKRYGTSDGLPSDDVLSLIEDTVGHIWAGTRKPGCLCRLGEGSIKAIETCAAAVSCLLEDRQKRIWAGGAAGGGVACYDGDQLVTYSRQDGGPGEHVVSMVDDEEGRVWFAAREGFYRLDGAKFEEVGYGVENIARQLNEPVAKDLGGRLWFGTAMGGVYCTDGRYFQRLTVEDGLPANSVVGLAAEADGAVLIGTRCGIVRYRPAASRTPRVRVTEVIADTAYVNVDRLHLGLGQARSVMFRFEGTSLTTARLHYRYFLDGLDTDWRDTWNCEVRYSEIPAGKYTFNVLAVNKELVPSAEPARLFLRVGPPEWADQQAEYEARIDEMRREVERHRRIAAQNRTLVELARSKALAGSDLDAALREITEVCAQSLNVDFASVWLFDDTHTKLLCRERYVRMYNEHAAGGEWPARSYPQCVAALEEERIISITDVSEETGLGEAVADAIGAIPGYEHSAILSAPIRLAGRTTGVVHLVAFGTPRRWTAEEEHFVSSIADLASVAIEGHQLMLAQQERQRMEAQLQQMQRLESLGVLAGGIAHDFNNLLMGVLGNADLALMDLPPVSPARESIEQIQNAAMRGAELTGQMLAYSGKGHGQRKPVNLSALVHETGRLLEVSMSKKATIEYDLGRELPAVEGDVSQLRQVVMNLMTNASEALGGDAGVIRVSTRAMRVDEEQLARTYAAEDAESGNYVCLTVSDTGCGMKDETQGRVFDPFFSTKFTGRGLGLAVVYGVIRRHGGLIDVHSEFGRGTAFEVYFPVSDAPLEEEAASQPAPATREAGGVILVVDDERSVRQVTKVALERFGFEVLLAEDGVEGLDRFREHKDEVRAVVLDLTMPNMDGEETFAQLRKMCPEVPVLLSSGYSEETSVERFKDSGLAGFIKKPYRPQVLVEKLCSLFEKPDA